MEKVLEYNKRIKDVGSGKNPKLINVGPTFIPDYRVGELNSIYFKVNFSTNM